MASKREYENFCGFVANCVFEDNFEDDIGFYIEVICRKLYKLGIVEKDGKNWVLRRGK